MVNPRISVAINTYYTSDNYLPEGKPLFDTLARDGVAVFEICADVSTGSDPDRRHTCSGAKTGTKIGTMITTEGDVGAKWKYSIKSAFVCAEADRR